MEGTIESGNGDVYTGSLKDARTQRRMCFWATRYDCFADKEELKLGVETIKRLLPQVEKSLLSDRQIASSFDLGKIRGNERNDRWPREAKYLC